MSRTTFSGPILAGDVRYNQYKDVGSVQLSQTIRFNESATITKTIYLPYNSRIININLLTYSAYSATTATISVGSSTSTTAYVAATNVTSAGNISPTPTTAWRMTPADVSSATTGSYPVSAIVLTLTINTLTTAGDFDVNVEYTQYDDRSGTFAQ